MKITNLSSFNSRVLIGTALPVIALFLLLTSAATMARAQVSTNIQGLSLTVSTNNPTPGQTVTITAQSFVSDLNSSTISWSLNGSAFKKAVGLTTIDVQAPLLGKQLTVSVTVTTQQGRIFRNSVTIGSGSVDLIVEAGGYTPPFFKGKVPLAYQNNYKIVAVPHLANSAGKEYDPRTLVYTWQKNSQIVPEQSGYGKQIFFWKDEIVPRQRTIDVRVSTKDGSASAEKTIFIQAGNPSLIFYQDDPLYGPLYNRAIGNQLGLGKSGEMDILAVPYGFNQYAGDPSAIVYSWLVNSDLQTALSTSRSIVLRAPTDTAGTSDITLNIKNQNDILETAKGRFTAVFGAQTSDSGSANSSNNNGL